jgi:ribosome-associated heat shock protein Hsp15
MSITETSKPPRVDQWLWAVRCFKTRSKATQACTAGKIRIDSMPVKASRAVRAGETISIDTGARLLIYEVVGFATKRLSATEAQKLYVDHSPPPVKEPLGPRILREAGSGRPTKRERRKMEKFRS